MLGRRSNQRGLFEGDHLYLDFVGPKTFYGFLSSQRDELFKDEDFAELYCADNGRRSVPPSLLCTALVLQHYDKCSDEEAWERASYDLRWKVALGTETVERPFAKSTLQLFRAQLLANQKMRVPFERSLELGRRQGLVRASRAAKLALDTSNILGRGAVRDTYNLISDGIRQVLTALAKVKGQKPPDYARDQGLGRHFESSIKGASKVDWDDEKSRSEFLAGLVSDAHRALRLAAQVRGEVEEASPADERIEAGCRLLATILLQDLEVKREPKAGADEQVVIKRETSGDRVCSASDPEMRHGRKSASKRFDGHKLSLAVEVESELITGVEVLAGSAADDEGALELVQASALALGVEIEEVLADCAYSDGQNRQDFREAGIELKAKVPVQGGEHFKKSDFRIDLEAMTCTCPADQTTDVVRRMGSGHGAGGRVPQQAFVFSAEVCTSCPLRAGCYKPSVENRGRRVFLHPQEALLQEARAWQQSPDFDLFRKQRQVVERRIARMMQLGMRQARYCGRRKTLFQALMTAAVANLTLIVGQIGLTAALETSTTALAAASEAVRTLQLASRTLWALLRGPLGRLSQPCVEANRPARPTLLAFATPGSRPGF